MAMDGERMLKGIPCRNREAHLDENDDGLLVAIPMNEPWWSCGPVRWLFPVSKERRIQLDAVGKYVLSRCNGKRTVENIIEQTMVQYQLSFHEARMSVLQFMRMLMQRSIIAVVMPKKTEKVH